MEIVGPRDKKNKENSGPFPIEGEYKKERDANELVVFESAQATPLFIVFTDPDIKPNIIQKDLQNQNGTDLNFFEIKGFFLFLFSFTNIIEILKIINKKQKGKGKEIDGDESELRKIIEEERKKSQEIIEEERKKYEEEIKRLKDKYEGGKKEKEKEKEKEKDKDKDKEKEKKRSSFFFKKSKE